MAQIVSETVVITFSRIVKDGESAPEIATLDIQSALEQVGQELAGAATIVEVIKA